MTPKRKLGRPSKPAPERRSRLVRMRVTFREWRRLKRLAREQGKTVADLLRDVLLKPTQ